MSGAGRCARVVRRDAPSRGRASAAGTEKAGGEAPAFDVPEVPGFSRGRGGGR